MTTYGHPCACGHYPSAHPHGGHCQDKDQDPEYGDYQCMCPRYQRETT